MKLKLVRTAVFVVSLLAMLARGRYDVKFVFFLFMLIRSVNGVPELLLSLMMKWKELLRRWLKDSSLYSVTLVIQEIVR